MRPMTLQRQIRDHYLSYSMFSNPGLYESAIRELPDDARELGMLIRKNIVHRTTLEQGNTGTNADLRFGDMTKIP